MHQENLPTPGFDKEHGTPSEDSRGQSEYELEYIIFTSTVDYIRCDNGIARGKAHFKNAC